MMSRAPIGASLAIAVDCADSGAGIGDCGVCANTPAASVAAATKVRILE